MPHRLWVVPALGFGLVLANISGGDQQSDAGKERAKFLQAQMGAARKTYETLWTDKEFRNVETPYQWSRRWLEVERLIKDKKEDQIEAVGAHLDRMKELQRLSNGLFQEKLLTRDQISAADFYVAEAEVWLLQAKQ
jgi:hypothetical protein